jgi:hypothetical protein
MDIDEITRLLGQEACDLWLIVKYKRNGMIILICWNDSLPAKIIELRQVGGYYMD